MYNLIKFVLFLLYNYWKKKGEDLISYETAILSLLAIIVFNFITILGIINKNLLRSLLPWPRENVTIIQYIQIIIFYVIPGYFILTIIFKKKAIINSDYSLKNVQLGNKLLTWYCILSILGFSLISILSKWKDEISWFFLMLFCNASDENGIS